MTWGVWWAYTPTGWQLCFSAWPVAVTFFAQLANPQPAPELSDERLAQFVDDTRKNPELWP